ncbi:hypothetical protein [Pseudomonas sp. AN3A02]|uniref:hypothetical protein n=1 Tax=Pseudomonas sp. AN3A02 TaxID=2719587 RepID=UPI001430404A|nr:hypothetical protein [Pseudomonas sp. AN3A02]NIL18179.1 hypothetical protein [Pseudomonas sp. AN3A02]
MTLSNASLTTGRTPNSYPAPLESLAPVLNPTTPPLTSDNTRAAGDRALAQNLCSAFANGFKGQTNIVVPPHSTLGEWQAQLNNALKNPEFQQWAKAQGIRPWGIVLYPDTNQLMATVNNQTKVFNLNDQSGWREVAGPVLAAAKIFAGGINGPVALHHIDATAVPHWLVAHFYGQDLDPTSLAQLASTYSFAPPTERLAASRSEQALQNQREVLGDINDRNTLKRKLHNHLVGMRLAGFEVDPNSSHQPKGFTRAEDFITGKGWTLPTTDEGFGNLLDVLRTPVPQSPPLANFWGFLSTPASLSTAQRRQLSAAAQAEIAPGQTLFSTLMGPTHTATPASPREQLEQMLTHPKALALGQTLEAELGILPTPTSRRELVLSALVLSLDANAGATRNKIAHYQLDQPGNWGKKPADIVQSVGDHLMTQSRVQPAHKDVAAYLMLSHAAPALLAQGLPDDLRYGTHQWASLSSAISKIEHLAPGASATMSYPQITDFAELEPITDDEEWLNLYTLRESMIDWAITNGALPKKDDGNYSSSDIATAKSAYKKEISDLGFAGQHLLKPIPTRRQMALDELKRVYGESINFERPVLQSIDGDQNAFYSLLDAHMSGELVKGRWRSINSQVSMHDLEQKFSRLNNIPRVFKSGADFHHYNLQRSEAYLVRHLLSQLPETDQQHLNLGTQKFYSLRKAISGASHLVSQEAIENGKGRHGIIIRSELGSDVRYYEVFPGLKKIVVRTDLPADLPAGRNVVPYSNYETDKRQAFDWDAYSSGTEPVRNTRSELIIEELIPETPWVPQHRDKTPGLSYSNSKTVYLASVAAKEHLVVPKKMFMSMAAGESAVELQQRYAEAGAAAALSLLPFGTTLKYAIEGNAAEAIGSFLIDATMMLIPGPKGLGTALRHSAKSLNTLRVMLTKATSNADDLMGLVAATHKNAKSFYSTIPSFGHKFAASNNLLKEASIAKGIISSIANGAERTELLAKYEGDKWYAVNPNTGSAYGAPLVGFRSDASVPLLQETLADGTTVQFSEKTLSKDAHIINRSKGYDLVDGEKVYRYDPARPDRLTDLQSAEHYKELDNFEAYCPAPAVGGRVRRGLNDLCFPKIIEPKLSKSAQVSQALEHQRLFPAPIRYNGTRTVVYEGRLFNVVNDKLVPHPFNTPIQYKPFISGTIVNDKFFGFAEKNFSNELNAESRVIKFDAISDISNDKRELRGLIVPSGSKKYLVVEVDPGRFYYRDLDRDTDLFTHIEFGKSPSDHLIYDYENIKEKFQLSRPALPGNFINLPPIDSIYVSLKRKGHSLETLNKLKAGVATLTPEKQREFVFNIWNKGTTRDIDIAMEPVRLPTLNKPANFNALVPSEKNNFFAREAKNEVDKQISTTGVGPANLRIAGNSLDVQRINTSKPLTAWLYEKFDASNDAYFNTILKTGAGNCDHMAHTAARIIQMNGGKARVMGMPDKHAFTVVGDISPTVKTVDFSEPVWKDIWISDPWAEIECPAPEYMKKFKEKMLEWKAKGQAIRSNDGDWINADDPDWLKGTVDAEKKFD